MTNTKVYITILYNSKLNQPISLFFVDMLYKLHVLSLIKFSSLRYAKKNITNFQQHNTYIAFFMFYKSVSFSTFLNDY